MPLEQKPQVGPWKGIADRPGPYVPDRSWNDLLNIWPYFGRMITRPRLNDYSQSPDGATIWNLIPFLDVLGNLHDLVLTTRNAYMITPGVTGATWNGPLLLPAWDSTITYVANDMVSLSGITYVALAASTNINPVGNPGTWAPLDPNVNTTALPFANAIAQGRVYFSNGSAPGMYSDGETTLKSMKHPGSFRGVGVLADHLITVDTTEPAPGISLSHRFPYRVRWSASGDPTSWVEQAGSSAGHVDLLEVPETISGYCTLVRTGFVAHTHGWTMMTPTGLGSRPFQFDTVSHAPKGVGVYYPQTLDVYGTIAVFVSEQDVYLFDGSSFTAIGGDAKPWIFADIQRAAADQIRGQIVARFNTRFAWLSYWLSMPSSRDDQQPVTWIYAWDSQSWTRFRSARGRLTSIANMVV